MGEGEGGMIWENDIEIHINIIYGTSHQSRFDARYWMLEAGALGRPRGMVWGGRREEGSGWGIKKKKIIIELSNFKEPPILKVCVL